MVLRINLFEPISSRYWTLGLRLVLTSLCRFGHDVEALAGRWSDRAD